MQPNRLTLAVCENFLPEAQAALTKNQIDGIGLISWKPCCEHPPKNWDDIANLLGEHDKSPLLIIGACFPRNLQPPPEHLNHISIHHLEQCFYLLHSKTQVDALLKARGHLISPAWLENWQLHLTNWGFDQKHAQIFFRDTAKEIVLLNTGSQADIETKLKAFSDYVGLPNTTINIGIDFIAQYLWTLILEWENSELKTSLTDRQEEAANYAMALSLLDELTDKNSAEVVINGTMDLFKMLLAPQHVHFHAVENDTNNQTNYLQKLSADQRNDLETDNYLLHCSADGFIILLQTKELKIGYLEISKVAFPNHIKGYLNLAITISPLCALAINKAKFSEKIATKNKELEVTNQQLIESDALLSESEEKYRSLYNNAPLPYQSLDVNGCFLDINPAWVKTLGHTREEVIGTRYSDLLHPDWQPHFIKNFPAFKKRGYVSNVQFKIRHKDGHYLDISFEGHISSSPDGQFKQTYCVFHDITEQKRIEEHRTELEEQLRQKHKMEAIGYMAGGMAHNFNNNLSIILGNIELSRMKQPADSAILPFLENAQTAVYRSRDLVKQITTYSRKSLHNRAPMQLPFIINETITLLRSTLPTTIKIQKEFNAESTYTTIFADPSQIQEVLINLCNNAMQAMDESGELKITLEPIKLEEKDIPVQYEALPGNYITLSVQDNGCGISPDILNKIFDPFFTTKAEYEGAGMGLATVQGIVAQHGGLIAVESILGQGTTFKLYFPVIDAPAKKIEAKDSLMPKGTEFILLVDDDPLIGNLGKQMLTEMGYTVSTMTESSEALKLFAANANHFDLVITDQTMPELTGVELIHELKKISPNIPTILCTGFSSKVDEEEAMKIGANAFLLKPLELPELLQKVRLVLDEAKT